MKRTLDILASATALLCLAPVLVIVAIIIRLESSGPSIFRQRRIGRFGVPFTIYKFRSMTDKPSQNADGPLVTVHGDSRITCFGKFLRRSKIDELPQLWNVLRGDMSLVGPRPEVEQYVALYSTEQRRVLDYRPGLTCQSSLKMYDEEHRLQSADDPMRLYQESILPDKVAHAISYAQHASVWSDLVLIVQTVTRAVQTVLHSSKT